MKGLITQTQELLKKVVDRDFGGNISMAARQWGLSASGLLNKWITGDGDMILINKLDIELRDGYIYLLTIGDELLVKRIFRRPNGITVHSDNTSFPDFNVEGQELSSCKVHGRVRWVGRIL